LSPSLFAVLPSATARFTWESVYTWGDGAEDIEAIGGTLFSVKIPVGGVSVATMGAGSSGSVGVPSSARANELALEPLLGSFHLKYRTVPSKHKKVHETTKPSLVSRVIFSVPPY
jgi:hypothetical protein